MNKYYYAPHTVFVFDLCTMYVPVCRLGFTKISTNPPPRVISETSSVSGKLQRIAAPTVGDRGLGGENVT